jgi:Rrf2 family iron-sulfur cluster assembly transcriptional regulator
LRFTLKIMRKLAICNIVKSFKGVQGGYELAHKPEEINLRQVIEAVDGPIVINRCLTGELPCSRIDDKRLCYYHNVFANVSETVRNKLEKITFQP